jgi:hypothetical protein
MDDAEIEREIQAKGLTAPRLTLEQINATIATEHYLIVPGTVMTICALVLKNGFSVVGTSAPASAENFDRDLGRKIAKGKAVDQIWQLEGYLLRQRLHDQVGGTIGQQAGGPR